MGKKYKFKLDGLLKIREFKEEKLKVELGEVLNEINEVEQKIKKMQEDIKQTYAEFDEHVEKGSNAEMIQFYPRFIQSRQEDIKNNENLLHSLNRRMNEKKKVLSKARGEVKVVENLKTKDKEKFKKERMKKEQMEIEELLQMRRNTFEQGGSQ